MSKPTERTTVYLDPRIKKNVRYYAVRDDKSLSSIINEKLIEYLEDQEDIRAIEEARANPDEFISFDELVKDLGLDIEQIRNSAANESKKAAKKNR